MHTLKNTVSNQTISEMNEEDWNVEKKKRSDRRDEINRPKKGIVINLEKNMEREFRETDIVQIIENLTKSSERSTPATTSRLVKFAEDKEGEPASEEENGQTKSVPAAGSVDGEILETQSGQSGEDSKQEFEGLSTED